MARSPWAAPPAHRGPEASGHVGLDRIAPASGQHNLHAEASERQAVATPVGLNDITQATARLPPLPSSFAPALAGPGSGWLYSSSTTSSGGGRTMMEALGYDAVLEGDSLTVLRLRPERAPAATRINLETAPSNMIHAPAPHCSPRNRRGDEYHWTTNTRLICQSASRPGVKRKVTQSGKERKERSP